MDEEESEHVVGDCNRGSRKRTINLTSRQRKKEVRYLNHDSNLDNFNLNCKHKENTHFACKTGTREDIPTMRNVFFRKADKIIQDNILANLLTVSNPKQKRNRKLDGDYGEDRGYFGLFTVCKILPYNRERCGKDYSKFRPSIVVWIAGILAATGVAILGVFCLCSILQLAMLTSKEKVVMKYSVVVILKLALGLLATLLAIAAAGLFALQTDEHNTSGIHITRGPGFYIQILLIVLNAVLFVMALYDVFFSRRPGGNPTQVADPPVAETIGNPGFRDRPQKSGEISMTDASGKPYLSSSTTTTNGSMNSVNTTSTTLGSNGSSFTLPKAPARSSLKKKPADGLGIQNPGFSGSSPTFSRNGSVKKVRIQTHSTDV